MPAKDSNMKTALGLMSGTSLDGIDVALIRTDGERVEDTGLWHTFPYQHAFQERVRALFAGKGNLLETEQELTLLHVGAVLEFLKKHRIKKSDIDVIGFHGQTIVHKPEISLTHQMGDGALLAARTGIDVVCDFRRTDVASGGQGAPIVPLYHAALAADLPKPIAIVNIGGVANITYISRSGREIIAFDTGPGNALINDFVQKHASKPYDAGGKFAARGAAQEKIVQKYLSAPYFKLDAPKSLDRNAFPLSLVKGLDVEDGAATLTEVTVQAIAKAQEHLPERPRHWYICGGGRHNNYMMQRLQEVLAVDVQPAEALGWQGDALEAQAMAFLAVRSLQGKVLTLPSTTGVRSAVTGGAFYRASRLSGKE